MCASTGTIKEMMLQDGIPIRSDIYERPFVYPRLCDVMCSKGKIVHTNVRSYIYGILNVYRNGRF